MGQVTEYCNGCAYLGKLSGIPWCAFYDVTGHTRGCPAGDGCTQKVSGNRRHPSSYFSEPPQPEEPPKPKKKREREHLTDAEARERETRRKRESAERNRALLQGRQRAVLVEYRDSHGLTIPEFAELVGVKASTLEKWFTEYSKADWEKLATLGITKPKSLIL